MKHLILVKLVENRITNLKSIIQGYTYCIKNNQFLELQTKNKEEAEKELSILQKHRQLIFDNYMIFNK